MELLQLRYFLKVSETESMTKAAIQLHVAQPSLSKSVSRLESELGVELFDRVGRRIRLNEYGRCFQKYAREALLSLDNGICSVKDMVAAEGRELVLATSLGKKLPGFINDYAISHPDSKLKILQIADHDDLRQQMFTGRADICISSSTIDSPGFVNRILTQDRICLITPEGHPLSGRNDLRLHEIASLPLVLYTEESILCDIIKRYFTEADLVPNVVCQCTTSEITCNLVKGGNVFGFLPEYLKEYGYTDGLSFIPFVHPEMERDVWLSYNSKRHMSPAAQEFVKHACDYHFDLANQHGAP